MPWYDEDDGCWYMECPGCGLRTSYDRAECYDCGEAL